MLIAGDMTLNAVMEAIVNATHGLTNEKGERATIGTIEPGTLKMAALGALMAACGQPIWPASHKITVPSRVRYHGPFVGEE